MDSSLKIYCYFNGVVRAKKHTLTTVVSFSVTEITTHGLESFRCKFETSSCCTDRKCTLRNWHIKSVSQGFFRLFNGGLRWFTWYACVLTNCPLKWTFITIIYCQKLRFSVYEFSSWSIKKTLFWGVFLGDWSCRVIFKDTLHVLFRIRGKIQCCCFYPSSH